FGPFRSPFKKDELDAPLDENTVNRCLELVRAHEARQNNKFGEHNRPLIATVSEGCSPYNTTVEPCDNPLYHSHSPPPSYRSHESSLEQLQNLAINAGNTRI
uniref:Amino acid permease/ SLC12A domain-containing protein n=1 Tax=Parascaris univalens TaxID=6257 RepID=A0A915B7T1_PARUN